MKLDKIKRNNLTQARRRNKMAKAGDLIIEAAKAQAEGELAVHRANMYIAQCRQVSANMQMLQKLS